MTPDDLAKLFTREALRPFQPAPGSQGLTPMLEVHTATAVLIFVLALDDFNDWEKRREYLATLGAKCALDGCAVAACRFGSEAWVRSFTPEEAAAKGTRLVETYADKEERIIVLGQLATGEMRSASARLHRRAQGPVSHLGPWAVEAYARVRSPLLEAFWTGYRLAKEESPDA